MVTTAPDRPDDLPGKVVAALDRMARARRSHRQATAVREGVTPLQHDLLATLAAGQPPTPLVGLLAAELGVTQPTVTDSLRTLESKRLIERRSDPTDARRTVVTLTGTGRLLAASANAADGELVDAVKALAPSAQAAALESLLTLIAHLVATGTIDVARTCLTCQFHRRDDSGSHRCTLLNLALPPADLRVNCPEHVAAAG